MGFLLAIVNAALAVAFYAELRGAFDDKNADPPQPRRKVD
jgi:hypothetical protein